MAPTEVVLYNVLTGEIKRCQSVKAAAEAIGCSKNTMLAMKNNYTDRMFNHWTVLVDEDEENED